MYELAIDNMLRLVASNVGTGDFGLYQALVAVVPSFDVAYFMDSRGSFESRGEAVTAADALGRMCSAAARIKAAAGPDGLSDRVMALTPDGWCVRGTLEACAPAMEA